VFQDLYGTVFTIGRDVQRQMHAVNVEGSDVLTLIDGDGNFSPVPIILGNNKLRILLISSPKDRQERKWLIQNVHDDHASYVVGTWEWKECAIASFVTSV
jgi:hypothetical protein